MKQNPAKEKIVNNLGSNEFAQQNAANTEKKKKEGKPKFTSNDLKGKKVDGDPALESDQPIKQVY